MKFEFITLFLLLINTIEDAGSLSNSVKLGERNFEDEVYQKAFKDLGKALKIGKLDNKDEKTLGILGKAIESGEISDKKNQKEFKLLGKAIVENTLDDKAKKLLGELLENGRDEKTYEELRDILLKNDKSTTLNQQGHLESQIKAPISASHDDITNSQESYSVVDNSALKSLSEVLKNVNLSEENEVKVMDLLVQACENKKLLSSDNPENSDLSTETPTLRKFLDGKYPQTLKLFEDAIALNQISKSKDDETLKFLSNVFTNKKPADKEAFNQLAEMLVQNEHLGNNVPEPKAPTTVISQEPPRLLLDGTVNESNGNQVSHIETTKNQTIPNDGSPNAPDSSFAGQNAENTSMEITESPELKKRSKRSSKSNVKSNSDSLQSKDKSKESRKSSKKTKRSRRSTKDSEKPTSKNKHKRIKRKKSKGKTPITGHDGVSNSKDIVMMGDDPNAYNPSMHSEVPFTQTASAKPEVVDSKTNDKSSTSNKNDKSKLFNSYYPEEYKRFVPLNPAIAYRRPKLLFMNDDNPIIPKLKTVNSGKSQDNNFKKYDIKPRKIDEVPNNRLVLTFTVNRCVQ